MGVVGAKKKTRLKHKTYRIRYVQCLIRRHQLHHFKWMKCSSASGKKIAQIINLKTLYSKCLLESWHKSSIHHLFLHIYSLIDWSSSIKWIQLYLVNFQVLGIICMSLASPALLTSTHWFLFIVVAAFIVTILWVAVYFLGIREVLNLSVNWILTVSYYYNFCICNAPPTYSIENEANKSIVF